MMQVQGVARAQHDTFPYSGMRVLGTFHVCCGATIFFLGVLDLAITMSSYEKDKIKYGEDYDIIVSLTVASSPLWCGMWFAVTGAIGTCITRERAYTLHFFKIVFLTLAILCAALFGPACMVLNGMIAFLRQNLFPKDYQWLLSLLIAFLTIVEIAMAIASASVACCCAHVRGTQVHVLVNTNKADKQSQDPGNNSDDNPTRWSSQSDQENKNEHDNDGGPRSQRPRDGGPSSTKMSLGDIDPEVNVVKSGGRSRPRMEIEEAAQDGFSESYPQLKKWALPGW